MVALRPSVGQSIPPATSTLPHCGSSFLDMVLAVLSYIFYRRCSFSCAARLAARVLLKCHVLNEGRDEPGCVPAWAVRRFRTGKFQDGVGLGNGDGDWARIEKNRGQDELLG